MKQKLDLSIENLRKLKNKDGFAHIDIAFGDFITDITENSDNKEKKYLFATAALASYAVRNRHICLDIKELAGKEFPDYSPRIKLKPEIEHLYVTLPEFEEWWNHIQEYSDVLSKNSHTPLRYDDQNRIFLQKYWGYEQEVAQFVKNKAKLKNDNQLYKKFIYTSKRLSSQERDDWQVIATFAALRNKFSVISGGPGTGKTSIITTIIAQIFSKDINTNIALCAPTGKAAARIKESLRDELVHLDCPDKVLDKLRAMETYTIHRLLGAKYNSPFFKHNRNNTLPYDWIIVDESSMVDLPLMAKLFQAIPEKRTSVVLLGDKDQLASVEAGAILNDLCESVEINCFSDEFKQELEGETKQPFKLSRSGENASLSDSIIELKKNYRFSSEDGIARIKDAIREGKAEQATNILTEKNYPDLDYHKISSSKELENKIIDYIKSIKVSSNKYFLDYLEADTIQEAWKIFSSFRIISSHRRGPFGSDKINSIIKQELFTESEYPVGLPVMISSNHPELELYNGDIGLIWRENGQKKVYFPDISQSDEFRSFTLGRLPKNSTVFAMTIHKSQGSGFDQILMLLPPRKSPLLTRELLYTGITRARKYCEIWGDRKIFKQAVQNRVNRHSGLKEKLA